MYQPPTSIASSGISISAWAIPSANTDGYILAKTNTDGSRFFYALRLVTNSGGTNLIFGLSSTGVNVRNELSSWDRGLAVFSKSIEP